MLSKGLGLFGEAERPSPGPQPLGREVLSLTHGSGLFLGQWDVGCVGCGVCVKDNTMTPAGLPTGLQGGNKAAVS